VTGFEVQAVEVATRPPVTTIERARAAKADRGGHRDRTVRGELHDDVIRESLGELEKEAETQVRRVAMPQKGVVVKTVERLPQAPIDLGSFRGGKVNARLADAAPFAAHLFALLGSEALQEIVEAAVATVVPVELAIPTQQESVRRQLVR